GTAIVAIGRAGSVAVAKGIAIVIVSAIELALIPYCQAHYGNGGLGVMAAFFAGEVFMVSADVYLLRGVLTKAIGIDIGRAIVAAAGTFGFFWIIGPTNPVVGI